MDEREEEEGVEDEGGGAVKACEKCGAAPIVSAAGARTCELLRHTRRMLSSALLKCALPFMAIIMLPEHGGEARAPLSAHTLSSFHQQLLLISPSTHTHTHTHTLFSTYKLQVSERCACALHLKGY